MNQVRRRVGGVGAAMVDSLRMKKTDANLVNNFGTHTWSNEDLDPVAPERRNWGAINYATYWISESWGATPWSVGSSMVAGGLLWWHAMIAIIFGHIIGACLTVWNGRGGSIYHIGFPVWLRATFGLWGSMIPVAIRCVLDMVWFGIQTYFGGLFLDIMFMCMFGHSWTNLPNHLPASSDTTTRSMVAYFLFWLLQFGAVFFRPHQLKWLLKVKACTIPIACFGLFIWALVRSGGPGSYQLGSTSGSKTLLAWSIVGAINSAINGEFGPLIASEPDITRYARRPRDQILGQITVAPWSASLTAILGIITASCTREIYGEAYWNPGEICIKIITEDNSPKTKFAIFLVAVTFMIGQIGTNVVANLIPFGVDASAMAPKYINITRAQIICCIVGGWCIVPWKVLVSGAVFLSCITGMGIFMGCLVGIMLGDYFFIRKGNYFIRDLYTSDPAGRYWYKGGFNWRAFAAYICGIALPFPGFLGTLGVKSLAAPLNAAHKIYNIGYLTSFTSSMVIYVVLTKVFPPGHIEEARSMPFEAMGATEVLVGAQHGRSSSEDVENVVVGEGSKYDSKEI